MIDPDGLMMIEPKLQPHGPVEDEFTEWAETALAEAYANEPGTRWRGFHVCSCGRRSGNTDRYVRGMLTNSLLVHYVRDHRVEVPMEELKKLEQF